MVVARKIANANPAVVTDTKATASALFFPAPAGRKVVGEPSKWLAVDPNFQQLPAIEWTNLEHLVRSERSLVASFRIQDAEAHYAAETCWLDHFENELGSVSNLWEAALSLQAASIGPSSQPAKLLLEVFVVGLAQRYWFAAEKIPDDAVVGLSAQGHQPQSKSLRKAVLRYWSLARKLAMPGWCKVFRNW